MQCWPPETAAGGWSTDAVVICALSVAHLSVIGEPIAHFYRVQLLVEAGEHLRAWAAWCSSVAQRGRPRGERKQKSQCFYRTLGVFLWGLFSAERIFWCFTRDRAYRLN